MTILELSLLFGASDLTDEGLLGEPAFSRSIGVGGVTVVTGVSRDPRGGVAGAVTIVGTCLFVVPASAFRAGIFAGIIGMFSGILEDLRDDMLPCLSLLKRPPKVFPPVYDDTDARSGLPFCVLFFLDPGLNASFNLNPGEILLDLDRLESMDSAENAESPIVGPGLKRSSGARLVFEAEMAGDGGKVVA